MLFENNLVANLHKGRDVVSFQIRLSEDAVVQLAIGNTENNHNEIQSVFSYEYIKK